MLLTAVEVIGQSNIYVTMKDEKKSLKRHMKNVEALKRSASAYLTRSSNSFKHFTNVCKQLKQFSF